MTMCHGNNLENLGRLYVFADNEDISSSGVDNRVVPGAILLGSDTTYQCAILGEIINVPMLQFTYL